MPYHIDESKSDVLFKVSKDNKVRVLLPDEVTALPFKVDSLLELLKSGTAGSGSGSGSGGYAAVAERAFLADRANTADYATEAGSVGDDVLQSLAQMFLSKVNDDIAAGLITFLKGLIAKGVIKAENGITFGSDDAVFYIDKYGNSVLRSLELQDSLIVPNLVYNKVEIDIGNKWNGPGGGTILSVEIDTDAYGNELESGIIELRLDDGEIGEVAVDDLCHGIWHNVDGGNEVENSDDGRGNFTFAGFSSVYFRIDEILETSRNSRFHYTLRAKSGRWQHQHHPARNMDFICYSNPTNKDRQNSEYSTRTYRRYLSNMTTWEIDGNNIREQHGEMSNLAIFDRFSKKNMSGYSGFMENIYFSGTIQELEDERRWMDINLALGGVMTPKDTEEVVVTIYNGYYVDITNEYTRFALERESGDSASDEIWNAQHTDVGSTFTLAYSDLGVWSSKQTRTMFTVYAYTDEGTVTTQSISVNV